MPTDRETEAATSQPSSTLQPGSGQKTSTWVTGWRCPAWCTEVDLRLAVPAHPVLMKCGRDADRGASGKISVPGVRGGGTASPATLEQPASLSLPLPSSFWWK